MSNTPFSSLPLPQALLSNLSDLGYASMTAVQAQALPAVLAGQDVIAQAKTGSGKTATFGLGLLAQLDVKYFRVQSLILCPTRELADQVATELRKLARSIHNIKILTLCGGAPMRPQITSLEHGAHIIVGTPGRVMDHLDQGRLKLDDLRCLVLDEADRMFDLGFIKDIRFLFRRMPPATERLSMLFSATLSLRVQELAYEHMNHPEHVQVEPEQMTGVRIKEELFYPSNEDKMLLLLSLMEEEWPEKAIVFANTKHVCEDVHAWLENDGQRVGLLTGDVPQKKRMKILEEFTKGTLDILVATDVAARGLHIPDVTHVFNYDLPDDAEDYVHRIGRTGRAGRSGHSISLACEDYAFNLPAIEEYIHHPIPVSKYDREALLDDVTAPKRVFRNRQPVNRNMRDRQGGGNSNNRRRPPRKN